jgi:hypothetical protein
LFRIAFVATVNEFPTIGWENHFFSRVDKFTNGTIETKSVNVTTPKGKNEFDRTAVRDITSTNTIGTGS